MTWNSVLKASLKHWISRWRSHQTKFSNIEKGDSAELLAYRFLRAGGYRIVARKYQRRAGEIDLIGWDGGVLAFVEVKYRTELEHGRPEEAVNRHKQKQISRVAREYRNTHHLHGINYRYDIVSIQGLGGSRRLRVIKDAFKEIS